MKEDIICRKCKTNKSITSFSLIDGIHRRRICNACRDVKQYHKDIEHARIKASLKRKRNPASAFLSDSRSSDKKKGRNGKNCT